MQLDPYDMAVIEQALREAINQGADYHKISTYQTVLGKMRSGHLSGTAASEGAAATRDGIRYESGDDESVSM